MSAAGVGVVPVGPGLTADDVADRIGAIADTYGAAGDARCPVADGFGVTVRVEHGALQVTDGVGERRRVRHFAKVSAPQRLVIAGDGIVTTEALGWCRAQGVAVVVLAAGDVTLACSPPGRDDARLRRAQAAAAGSPVGLAIVSRLLSAKLAGQAAVLRDVFTDTTTAGTVEDLAAGVEVACDVDEARQLEAVAAACYFAAWNGHDATTLRWVAKDRGRVPPHWSVYDGRRSAITGAANTNARAERPLNGLLNYLYRLVEVEARAALVRLGLDPGLGVLHADAPGRDSFALDVIEPVRPEVDRFVLRLVADRSFTKSCFVERSDGHVRVAAPLTHELAATMPTWAAVLAPWAEAVAHMLTDTVAGKTTRTTPLTNRRAVAAQAEVRRRKAAEALVDAEAVHAKHRADRPRRRPATPSPLRAAARLGGCVDCGAPTGTARRVRCDACIGTDPSQSLALRQSRARAISSRRQAEAGWSAHHPAGPVDTAWWEGTCRPGLAEVKVGAIMRACGVSKSSASGWRSGKHVPHPMHWETLAGLAGVAPPEATEHTEGVGS